MGVQTLGLALLHFIWQGALIGAVAAGALRSTLGRTARDRYLICLFALLACLLAPVVTGIIILDDVVTLPDIGTSGAPVGKLAIRQLAPAHAARHYPDVLRCVDWIALSVGAWSLGALSVAAYYVLQWIGVERVRRSAFPLREPAHLAASAARLLRRWKATANVLVMLSHAVTSPIVIGLWRPLVIFPAATVARMSVADFELFLLHEIAHIVRRDAWANALQVALEILLFYHPVVHWLSRRARLERECACDDFAVTASGSAYRYAQALTSLALTRNRPSTLGLGVAGADLLPRLRNLAGECAESETSPRNPVQLFLIALALTCVVWMSAPPGGPVRWSNSADGPVPTPRSNADVPSRRAPLSSDSTAEPASPPPPVVAATERIPPRRTARARASPALADTDFAVAQTNSSAARTHSDVAQTNTAAARIHGDVAHANSIVTEADTTVGQTGAAAARFTAPPFQPDPASAEADTEAGLASASKPDASRADTAAAEPPAPALPEPHVRDGLIPSYSPAPDYPLQARLDGVEGSVVVVLRIGADGRPTGLRIVEANPLGVFESAVRRALMKWRYATADSVRESGERTVAYRLNFSISGVSSSATPLCATATASRTCSPQ